MARGFDARTAIMQASASASALHERHDSKNRLVERIGGLDVYRLAEEIDIPVMFAKLSGLLGAYICDGPPGIAISTERGPSIQRFTCAHELGHHELKHESTFDYESSVGFDGGSPSDKIKETQADVFASHLLMPTWLLADRAKDLRAAGMFLDSPVTVYQLSLRVGTSYAATLHTLIARNLIKPELGSAFKKITPKSIKQRLLRDYAPTDWHRDVWILTAEDDGEEVQARSADTLLIKVRELASAGYLSQVQTSDPAHAKTVATWHDAALVDHQRVGGPVQFVAAVDVGEVGAGNVSVTQRRPWESEASGISQVKIELDVFERSAGLSREAKKDRIALIGATT